MAEKLTTDLTTDQKDYAIFLPAISSFYSTFVGKQRYGEYVAYDRVPKNMPLGVESGNWLEPAASMWNYKWSLYSAGHAN